MTILLLGAGGQLGWELGAALAPLGPVAHFGRPEADLSRPAELRRLVLSIRPDAIVNAAAHTKVDQAEGEPEAARAVNGDAPALLAALAKNLGAWLVHYSTDYVFDGRKDGPYTEEDEPAPLSVYGRTKLEGDQAIMASGCRHLIFRTSWVYGPRGHNFPRAILDKAAREDRLAVVEDQVGSPTSVELLAGATALALYRARQGEGDRLSGLYNLTAGGFTSWHGYAVYLLKKASELGWDLLARPEAVAPIKTGDLRQPAARPANSRLSTAKLQSAFGLAPPPWQYYVDRQMWAWTAGRDPARHNPPKLFGTRYIVPMNGVTLK